VTESLRDARDERSPGIEAGGRKRERMRRPHMVEKKSPGRKRIKVRELSESALRDLSKEELERVTGAMRSAYKCPGDCDHLTIETLKGSLFLVSMRCKRDGGDLTVKLP
jgi:predicted metalloprotease